MLALAIGAAQLLSKSGILGGLTANDKDPERIATANAKAEAAIAGDVEAAKYVYGAQTGSATQVGKDAYKAAWARIVAARPDVAQAAVPGAVTAAAIAAGPAPTSALQQEVTALRDKLRGDIADSVQRIGAGATTALTDKIAPDGQATSLTIPTSKKTLGLIAAGVVVAFVAVYLLARRK